MIDYLWRDYHQFYQVNNVGGPSGVSVCHSVTLLRCCNVVTPGLSWGNIVPETSQTTVQHSAHYLPLVVSKTRRRVVAWHRVLSPVCPSRNGQTLVTTQPLVSIMQANGQASVFTLTSDLDLCMSDIGWWVTIGGGRPRPLLVQTQNTDTTQQHTDTGQLGFRKMELHQIFSSTAFIAHPSLTFYLKCVKTKNKFVVVFAHSNWRHLGWAEQSCRRSRSLCLSSANKIFVGTETRSENNIGFSSLQ